jgi:glutathione peroxidase
MSAGVIFPASAGCSSDARPLPAPIEKRGEGKLRIDSVVAGLKLLLLIATACVFGAPGAAVSACPALLDHRFNSLQGKPLDLCEYANHPILVVNTASKCGYTPQFDKLEAMYKRYRSRGLVVVGFPSNDFNQELATNKEIGNFCRLTYFVEFPMIEKSSVTGTAADPFFRQLRAVTGEAPQWNFHKYLIAPDGKTVYSFRSQVEPDSREIMSRLAPMLR